MRKMAGDLASFQDHVVAAIGIGFVHFGKDGDRLRRRGLHPRGERKRLVTLKGANLSSIDVAASIELHPMAELARRTLDWAAKNASPRRVKRVRRLHSFRLIQGEMH